MRKISIAILLIPMVLFACKSKKSTKNNDGLTGGVLEFSDDFNRKDLGDMWINNAAKGAYQIKNGKLYVHMAHNKGLWLKHLLPPKARIEFDSIALSKDVDTKCEVFAAKAKHETGYIVILGGWHNRLSIIARLDEHGKDRLATDVVGKPNKKYHWTIVRTDNNLRWYLDGKLFLEYKDQHPLKGLYFGFNDWEAPVYFDNLKIYRL